LHEATVLVLFKGLDVVETFYVLHLVQVGGRDVGPWEAQVDGEGLRCLVEGAKPEGEAELV